MIDRKTLTAATLCFLAGSVSGCSSWTKYGVSDSYGDAVRANKAAQVYDPIAAHAPSTDPVEGTDGQRMEAVMEAHRNQAGSAAGVSQPIVINVGE